MKDEYKILLVDDSESDRLSCVGYLRSDSACSYRIIEAETLEEGLELWRSQSPDLVLTEINLPDGSGLELLEAIGKTDPSLKCPVIVITGKGDERLAVQAMKLGASDYLVKDDIKASILCHYVETAIAQWHLSEKLTELKQFSKELQASVEERQQLIAQLQDSEQRYATLTSIAPVGIFRTNAQGECIFFNEAYSRITTITYARKAGGVQWIDLLHPGDRERVLTTWSELSSRREVCCQEFRLCHPDGKTIWIYCQAVPESDSLGQPAGYVGTMTDITPQKESQARLQESEVFLEEAQRIAHIGNWSFDLNTKKITWSAELFRMFGLDPNGSEPDYADYLQYYIHPEDSPILENHVAIAVTEGKSYVFDYRAMLPDGTMRYHEARGQLERNQAGNPNRLFGTAIDITERKTYENKLQKLNQNLEAIIRERTQALKNSKEFVQNILDTIPLPIFWKDRHSRLLGCNQKLANLMGLESSDELNMPKGSEFSPAPEEVEKYESDDQTVITSGQAILGIEENFTDAQGNQKIIETHKGPLRDGNGEIIGVVGMFQDVTERRRTERENCQLKERLEFLVSSSPAIIYSCKPSDNFRTTFISQNIEQVLGYKPEDLLTQTNFWANHIHPEDVPKIFTELPALCEKETHTYEYRFLHQDGHYIWIRDQLRLVKDDQGNPIEIVGAFSDISDRKLTEEALNTERLRLKLALDAAKMGTWSCSSESDQLIWSDRSQEIFGFVPGTFSGDEQTLFSMIHPEDRDRVAQAIAHTFATGEAYHLEYRIFRLDGEMRWVTVWGVLSETLSTNKRQLIGIIADISDRKQAELELKKSQKFLQTVLDSFPLAVFWKNHESVLLGCNQFFAQISELDSPEAVVGKTNFDFSYTEAQAQGHLLDDQQVMRSGIGLVDIEETITLPTGEIRWIETNKVPLRDLEGNVIGILGTFQDITERVENRQKLLDLTDRLKIALNSGAIGCWEWDIAHNTLTWDERMHELNGVPYQSNSALTYDHWANALHPQDFNRATTLIQQAVAGEAEYDPEFRVIHPDGSIHFLKAYGVVMRDAQGNPQCMIGVNFDITAQKQAEQIIHQQIEKETVLRQITQNMRETLDLQRIFDTACQEIREFVESDRVAVFKFYPDSGFDDGEFVAESLKEGFSSVLAIQIHDHCFGEDYAQRYTEGHFQVVNDVLKSDLQDCHKAVLSQFEIRANLVIPLRRGEKLWGLLCIHTCTAPRTWQPDEIDLIQQIANQLAIAIQQADLFEQVQQEQEKLTQSNQALARATRLKDEFLANMSHELRTPLNAILGMAEGLQEAVFGTINQKQVNALQTIEKSGLHLLSLINDILNVAKIELGQLELEYSSISVTHLCSSSLVFIKQQALQKSIRLETQFAPDLTNAFVDERRIRQVLINLLTNAVKFTPEGGTITLTASPLPKAEDRTQQHYLRIAVSDTGIGIAPENINKLFQPFVQIDGALNRQYAGTGLGLALVKQIVELHGGRVELSSQLGMGSCFSIDLPCKPEAILTGKPSIIPMMTGQDDGPATASDVPLTSPLILLAEDNEAIVITISSYLIAKGYRIISAKNGKEAIAMIYAESPNLILMDIQMPEMDGLEAMRQLRQDPNLSKIPIIALTALAMAGDRERCLEAGANDYLSKPVSLRELASTIHQLL